MSTSPDMHSVLLRAYERARKLLAPQERLSADIGVHAALWLFIRCGGDEESSCLFPLVAGHATASPLHLLDLPTLSIQGFRLGSRLDLGETRGATLDEALEQITRRKPRTEELSGPADDPLCLLGLILLASKVAPRFVSVFESWVKANTLSPPLRAAFVLGGVASLAGEFRVNVNSPRSLASYLLISAGDARLVARLFPAINRTEIVSHFATCDFQETLGRGGFDSLVVLIALELLSRDAGSVPTSTPQVRRIEAAAGSLSVLLVCANPHGTDPARLRAEVRALREAIRLATHRDKLTLDVLNATTIDDLRRQLLRDTYDIVQFSGHGSHDGLYFEDSSGEIMVPNSIALAELLHRHGVKTVVLNACDSLGTALAGTSMFEYTIAMDGHIDDEAALEFSRGFYDALGEDRDIPDAFAEGRSCCRLKHLEIQAVLRSKGDLSKNH